MTEWVDTSTGELFTEEDLEDARRWSKELRQTEEFTPAIKDWVSYIAEKYTGDAIMAAHKLLNNPSQ